jgi:hypothetical protein
LLCHLDLPSHLVKLRLGRGKVPAAGANQNMDGYRNRLDDRSHQIEWRCEAADRQFSAQFNPIGASSLGSLGRLEAFGAELKMAIQHGRTRHLSLF